MTLMLYAPRSTRLPMETRLGGGKTDGTSDIPAELNPVSQHISRISQPITAHLPHQPANKHRHLITFIYSFNKQMCCLTSNTSITLITNASEDFFFFFLIIFFSSSRVSNVAGTDADTDTEHLTNSLMPRTRTVTANGHKLIGHMCLWSGPYVGYVKNKPYEKSLIRAVQRLAHCNMKGHCAPTTQ